MTQPTLAEAAEIIARLLERIDEVCPPSCRDYMPPSDDIEVEAADFLARIKTQQREAEAWFNAGVTVDNSAECE